MNILMLFRNELSGGWQRFFLLAALAGAANAAVLAAINNAAAHLHDSDIRGQALLILVLGIVVFIMAQKALMTMAATLAEGTVNRLRAQLLERLRSAELPEVEGLNRNEIYAAVNAEMQVISGGAPSLMIIGQALLLVVMILTYMAFLSLWAFFLAIAFIVAAISLHLSRAQQISDKFAEAGQVETQLMDGFTDLVEGFKEIKLNTPRSNELAETVRSASRRVMESRLNAAVLFANNFVISQVMFFLLTGMMVFVVPMFSNIDSEALVKITTASLFLIGPLSNAVSGFPILQRVDSAAKAILSLESRLSEIGRGVDDSERRFSSFERIALRGAMYRYPGSEKEPGFAVGPIDLEIRRGEVVFITGGNGSGKSTLLKLLTGLYMPTSGALALDGTPVGPENAVGYRNLFSAIFSDYHLFRRLYGIPEIDPKQVSELLRLLEMEDKVNIVDHAFDTIAVSGGQRKRLAMIELLLEDRPICLFDEWAADQDPHFREKFYRMIIPSLQEAGRTIIAITHDDKYFDVPDLRVRRVHMEEGRIVDVRVR